MDATRFLAALERAIAGGALSSREDRKTLTELHSMLPDLFESDRVLSEARERIERDLDSNYGAKSLSEYRKHSRRMRRGISL